MRRLVLIDGKSVFYRGYYAMGALSLKDGTPTGGVYGFAAIAMEIVKKLNPTKVVVAWDSPSSTSKRKALYQDYKAGRVKPGDDFYAQIPLLKELIADLGWSLVELDDYEADDIIGTLSREADEADKVGRASGGDEAGGVDGVSGGDEAGGADETDGANGAGGWETYIISSDLDMLQIVDENTHMWRILKGFTNIEQMDIREIEEKYGIKKSQFLDLKSLKGDSSDNIPGVPGIGEKTAAKLLNEYGDLDNIYQNLDKITGSTRLKLEQGKDLAYLSRDLARIMFDAPVDLAKIPDFKFDKEKVISGLKKLEFNSLIRKIEKIDDFDNNEGNRGAPDILGKNGKMPKKSIGNVDNPDISGKTLNMSENSDNDDATPVVLGKSAEMPKNPDKDDATSGDLDKIPKMSEKSTEGDATPDILGKSAEMPKNSQSDTLESTDIIINLDIKSLMHANKEVAREIIEEKKPFWDLSQAAFLLDPLRRESLPPLLDPVQEYREQIKEFQNYPKLMRIYQDFDLLLIPVLYQMEEKGMLIDRVYFQNLQTEYNREVADLEQKIYTISGQVFNLNSPIQLSEVLFVNLGLPTKGIKKTTRGYSTGAKELEKLKSAHPIIEQIIKYREAAKLLGTYITPIPDLADKDNRIHTTFTQDVTSTGRLSSKDPNLQNIPVRTGEGKRIRAGFVAPEGYKLVSADYSQFELRLAAVLAGDKNLIDDFNQDVDIHTKTASEAFRVPMEEVTKDQRRAAKAINFGIIYGMSIGGLAESAKMSFAEAKAFMDNYYRLRAPVMDYMKKTLEKARTEGYVETFYGRRRPTPDVKSSNFVIRQAAERAAQNMPIQGTEADLMKRAMINISKKLPRGAALVMQVHDSLIVECPVNMASEVADLLKTEMESVASELAIKLAVDVTIGDNWGEL